MREQRTYFGIKQLKAAPMTRGEYNKHRGWPMPPEEDPTDEGYLVEYADGYQSWSPRDQFESHYIQTENDGTLGVAAAHAMIHDVNAIKINDNAITVQVMCRNGAVFHETAYSQLEPANDDQWNMLAEAAMQKCMMTITQHLVYAHKWAVFGLAGAFMIAPEMKLSKNVDLVSAAGRPLKLTV